MSRIYIICIVIIFASACKSNEYLLIEAVKGKVVSSLDKQPISDVKIYVDKSAFNAFDTISTANDGRFFVDKLAVSDSKDTHQQRGISYSFVIEKKGFKKVVIDVRNFRKHKAPNVKDTIDLGLIYLNELQTQKNVEINNKWPGSYTGSFLRMKEESADPRGWGQIKIEIGKESAKFQLDSYVENVQKDLKILHIDEKEVQFAALDDKNLKLTIRLNQHKYLLSGNLMEQIVGIKETYTLEKKSTDIENKPSQEDQNEVFDADYILFNGKLKRFFTLKEFKKTFGEPDSAKLMTAEAPCAYIFENSDGSKNLNDKYLFKDGSRFENSIEKVAVDEFRFTKNKFISYKGKILNSSTTLTELRKIFPNAVKNIVTMDVYGEGKLQTIQLREDEKGISDGHVNIFIRNGKLYFMHWWFPC